MGGSRLSKMNVARLGKETVLTAEISPPNGENTASSDAAVKQPGSMLLVLPVPFRATPQGLAVESQAANGIRRWAAEFSGLCVAAPVIPEYLAIADPTVTWVNAAEALSGVEAKLEPLPWGYGPAAHFRLRKQVIERFVNLIGRYRYLQFAISGCTFGDWPAVAARVARKSGRAYSVHTDWVTHRITVASSPKGIRGLRRHIEARAMKSAERRVIQGSALGLFHGADCYETYRTWCSNPQLIHDVHLSSDTLISPAEMAKKMERVREGNPLRILYAGRAAAMKGPEHWLRAMGALRDNGIRFTASWFGDGPLLDQMRTWVRDMGLSDLVTLHGQATHAQIIQQIRAADVLVFCHLTPESPRILLEALTQATPIVGYTSHYPADLTKDGGGALVEQGQWKALATAITALSNDRNELARLIHAAGTTGQQYTDTAVFKHRADLIKKYLA
jgi:glycosyltransferase involved in cell wall biosynthesis